MSECGDLDAFDFDDDLDMICDPNVGASDFEVEEDEELHDVAQRTKLLELISEVAQERETAQRVSGFVAAQEEQEPERLREIWSEIQNPKKQLSIREKKKRSLALKATVNTALKQKAKRIEELATPRAEMVAVSRTATIFRNMKRILGPRVSEERIAWYIQPGQSRVVLARRVISLFQKYNTPEYKNVFVVDQQQASTSTFITESERIRRMVSGNEHVCSSMNAMLEAFDKLEEEEKASKRFVPDEAEVIRAIRKIEQQSREILDNKQRTIRMNFFTREDQTHSMKITLKEMRDEIERAKNKTFLLRNATVPNDDFAEWAKQYKRNISNPNWVRRLDISRSLQ
jgi:hypothetical protein